MAKREALRGLQVRLAERLQQAQNQGVSASWLAVEAGEFKFLLPLELAGEIFSPATAQKVPYALPWFVGVANLRGGLYGVVDLSAFLGGAPVANKLLAESARQDARYIALNAALEVNSALLVSRLVGLRSTRNYVRVDQTPQNASAFLGPVYFDEAGQAWQELNLQALATATNFLTIGS